MSISAYELVGLMQIKLFGAYVPEEPENYSFKYVDEKGRPKKVEHDGLESSSEMIDHKYTEEMLSLGGILDRNKKRCVQEENFKKAKEAQLAQRLLKKATKEMEELEKDKNDAIQEEDFQRAQDLKDEMKTLRANVLAAIDPKLLEDVPNDPGPSSDDVTIRKPASIYETDGLVPPPKLFQPIRGLFCVLRGTEPIKLSPRSTVGTSASHRVKTGVSAIPDSPTPREDRHLLNGSPTRSEIRSPKPIGDLPLRPVARSPIRKSPKPATPPRTSNSTKSPTRTPSRKIRTASTPSFHERRPATRESYIPARSEKSRQKTSGNRFYEKENMVVPAALKGRRTSDPEIQTHRRHREEPPALTEAEFLDAIHSSDRSMASRAIDTFGLTTVQKIYSKNFNQRREGLQELQEKLENSSGVYTSALDLFRYIGETFIPENRLEKSGAQKYATATAEPLISVLGNSAKICKAFMPRLLARFESGGQKSDRPRAEIVYERAKALGIPQPEAGLDEKAVGKFSIAAMKHSDSEVKTIGKKFFVMVYENGDRKALRKMLPDDSPSTRNPVYRQLHEELRRIDDGEGRGESRGRRTGCLRIQKTAEKQFATSKRWEIEIRHPEADEEKSLGNVKNGMKNVNAGIAIAEGKKKPEEVLQPKAIEKMNAKAAKAQTQKRMDARSRFADELGVNRDKIRYSQSNYHYEIQKYGNTVNAKQKAGKPFFNSKMERLQMVDAAVGAGLQTGQAICELTGFNPRQELDKLIGKDIMPKVMMAWKIIQGPLQIIGALYPPLGIAVGIVSGIMMLLDQPPPTDAPTPDPIYDYLAEMHNSLSNQLADLSDQMTKGFKDLNLAIEKQTQQILDRIEDEWRITEEYRDRMNSRLKSHDFDPNILDETSRLLLNIHFQAIVPFSTYHGAIWTNDTKSLKAYLDRMEDDYNALLAMDTELRQICADYHIIAHGDSQKGQEVLAKLAQGVFGQIHPHNGDFGEAFSAALQERFSWVTADGNRTAAARYAIVAKTVQDKQAVRDWGPLQEIESGLFIGARFLAQHPATGQYYEIYVRSVDLESTPETRSAEESALRIQMGEALMKITSDDLPSLQASYCRRKVDSFAPDANGTMIAEPGDLEKCSGAMRIEKGELDQLHLWPPEGQIFKEGGGLIPGCCFGKTMARVCHCVLWLS
ncbi:unnamed protein product, partial [Mesorhabditis spiculigera]